MSISAAKEAILKKIRKALTESTPLPFPLSEGAHNFYPPPQNELSIAFAESFTRLQGRFAFCLQPHELYTQLGQLIADKNWTNIFCNETDLREQLIAGQINGLSAEGLATCDASITSCECLVARTGTIVLSAHSNARTPSVYAPVHVCIAHTKQLVYDVRDALQLIKDRYAGQLPSLITFASGPSRTADIEKTLVTGVHGPKEVYLFLRDQ